ncbi:PREDICTED: uncharacterized protein LOC106292205 [Brassica oleracea var. oleracea]|uniref:uncharacterized protein LOC106292205 n=1 Tax=Brassica oleracea var. oleracea TaxID=109376 RepID=UPI0006A6BE75|nr:PREDICTED: uncharacterized protein LOC106292205 [Brassica oleracea var. oleracea]
MWKIFHGTIPVGEQLIRRHIGVDGNCKLCGRWTTPEDIVSKAIYLAKEWETNQVPAYFVGSPLTAEGLALLEAVTECKELGYTRICCESDSSQLIQAVTTVTEASELYGITADINAIASTFEAISFRWISQMNNVVADNLAKQVLADETTFIVPSNFA